MRYLEVTFHIQPYSETAADVLAALCGEVGFESFVPSEDGTKGYIPEAQYDERALRDALSFFPMKQIHIAFQVEPQEDKDWNEEWEKHFFQPIVVGNECVIHSTFHTHVPKARYDILINPQMAFGTGHHETTSLVLSELLQADLEGKALLDMGCGTSILAILASMRGASPVTAIDIDDWCVSNSKDNIQLNHLSNIQVELGDASLLKGRSFQVIVANINRNILLRDMAAYVDCLSAGAEIYMSGFYVEDIPVLREEGERLGLRFVHSQEKHRWAVVKMVRA